MRKIIINFNKNSLEKTIVIKHKTEENILYNWLKVNTLIITLFNTIFIFLSKYLPLKLKNLIYRYILGIHVGKNTAISPGVEFDPFYPQLV